MSKLITEYQKPDTELKEQLREIKKQTKVEKQRRIAEDFDEPEEEWEDVDD